MVLPNRFTEDPRGRAIIAGAAIGSLGGLVALLIVLAGPIMALGAVVGLAVALLVLTELHAAFAIMVAVVALLPFGTVPFQLGVTPTLLDGVLAGFFGVYLLQWMTGQRRLVRTTPVNPVVLGFIGIMLFAFLMGLRHAPLSSRVLRSVAEMVLSLLLVIVLVDVMRSAAMLRRAVLALAIWGSLAAVIGIVLWVLPDLTAESLLNRLGRLGYPVGGVIRYRQTPGAMLNERAIGTWIDPNAFGGFLLMIGAVIAPQIFSRCPIVRRWLAGLMLGVVVIALFLTDSRGSMLSLGAALVFIAALRYRRLLLIMALAGGLALFLPVTQRYVAKFQAGITGQDVETQMRFGEYRDALTLINRHPIIGVGFSGTPEIDLYLGVANTYLTIASHAGFVGLAAYLIMIGSAFVYGALHYHTIRSDPDIDDVWLGLTAAMVGMLAGGVFDHFYFNIEQFHATMTTVWIIMGLMLAATRLAVERAILAAAEAEP
ncbi:MAG: hypothetical protein GX573_11890 [Chloroflexi bacterium]|nr:hypothetical protein [Chloroflexota bacterium]